MEEILVSKSKTAKKIKNLSRKGWSASHACKLFKFFIHLPGAEIRC
jgi:hypothetical protein